MRARYYVSKTFFDRAVPFMISKFVITVASQPSFSRPSASCVNVAENE